MKRFLPLLTLFAVFAGPVFAQNVIEVQIDHGGLHCPYLGPRFKEHLSASNSVDSVQVDRVNSIGYLYVTDGVDISDEEITDIIVHKVGYPKVEIKAIIRGAD